MCALVKNYLQITAHELKQAGCGGKRNQNFLYSFRSGFFLSRWEAKQKNIESKTNSCRVNIARVLFRQSIIAIAEPQSDQIDGELAGTQFVFSIRLSNQNGFSGKLLSDTGKMELTLGR